MFKRSYPVKVGLFVAAGLLASGLSAHAQAKGDFCSSSASPAPAVATNKVVMPQIAGASLDSDRAVYVPGQSVYLLFTLVNTTKKSLHYDFDAQPAQVAIFDAKGNPVWHWTQAKAAFQGLTHLILQPGQSHTYRVVWKQRDDTAHPVAPGAYTAMAQLNPIPRVLVSGGIIVNTEPDPNNTGMPTKGKLERGATRQSNTTPPVMASTQFTIKASGRHG